MKAPAYTAVSLGEVQPLFVGDIHARPELVVSALSVADSLGAQALFLGDLLDGPGGAQGSAECVRLVRESGSTCILGNHELYPIFAKDQSQLARWWGDDPKSDTACRIWEEWLAVKRFLSDEDLDWLRKQPLWVRGEGWIAVHAKLPATLPAQVVTAEVTDRHIACADHTEAKPFWAESYDGRHGHCYFGHTRLSKVGQYSWRHATLLDWDAKKGGTAAVALPGGTVVALPG